MKSWVPAFAETSGAQFPNQRVGGEKRSLATADSRFALTLTRARRGACHRAALGADPLAPLPIRAACQQNGVGFMA
jgi:hypothetical protein